VIHSGGSSDLQTSSTPDEDEEQQEWHSNLLPSKKSLMLDHSFEDGAHVQLVDEPYLMAIWQEISGLSNDQQSENWDEIIQYLQAPKLADNLEQSIIAGRELVSKLEWDGQTPPSLKAFSIGLLANLLEQDKQFEDAGNLYRKAIDTSSDKNTSWRLEFYLGRVLLRRNRFSDAAPLLLSSLSQLLRAQLSSPICVEIIDVLSHFHATLIKLHSASKSLARMRSLVSRIQALLTWEIQKPVWNPVYDLDVLLLALKLTLHCLLLWPESGRKLYLALGPKLSGLDVRKRLSEYTQVCSQQAFVGFRGLQNDSQHGIWEDPIAEIPAMYYTIRELENAHDVTNVHLVTRLRDTWDRIPRIVATSLDQDTINSLIMDARRDDRVVNLLDDRLCDPAEVKRVLFTRAIEQDKRQDNRDKNLENYEWTNGESSRYGITYTDSAFSGVSFDYSELFPPGI